MKKSTVSSTAAGAGQLFASVPRSFNSFGTVLAATLAGLSDNVRVAMIHSPSSQNLVLSLVGSATSNPASHQEWEATPLATTRTAYEWNYTSGPANIVAPPSPLSVAAFVDYLFREGATQVIVDQVSAKVISAVGSSITTTAEVSVATFTTTNGNTWE